MPDRSVGGMRGKVLREIGLSQGIVCINIKPKAVHRSMNALSLPKVTPHPRHIEMWNWSRLQSQGGWKTGEKYIVEAQNRQLIWFEHLSQTTCIHLLNRLLCTSCLLYWATEEDQQFEEEMKVTALLVLSCRRVEIEVFLKSTLSDRVGRVVLESQTRLASRKNCSGLFPHKYLPSETRAMKCSNHSIKAFHVVTQVFAPPHGNTSHLSVETLAGGIFANTHQTI